MEAGKDYKEAKETFEADGRVHYVDCGVHMLRWIILYSPDVCGLVHFSCT